MSYKISDINYIDDCSVGDWNGKESQAAKIYNDILDIIASNINVDDDDTFYRASQYLYDNLVCEDILAYTDDQKMDAAMRSLLTIKTKLQIDQEAKQRDTDCNRRMK